jgi:broad specificity phosphatase PhoE
MKKIILLRHGEVDVKDNNKISANEFGQWIIKYNNSNIKFECLSKNEIKSLFDKSNIIICSNLKRSIQSAELFNKIPFEINDIFKEAKLPYSNWTKLKLSPKIWLIIFRILWLFGYYKNSESLQETKQRAKIATQKLLELSKNNDTILLVGHGVFNRFIKKELIRNQWKQTKKSGNKNWDYGIFEYQT